MSNVLYLRHNSNANGCSDRPQCFVSYLSSHHPCVHDINIKLERGIGGGGGGKKMLNLRFMGPCILNILQYIFNKMQSYTVFLYLQTALRVSGGTSTHHQERKQLNLQQLVFVIPLLLPAGIAAGSSNGVTNARCCRYSCLRS
jgi:hypothetical protein